MKYGFGIDVGGTSVKLAFFSEEGQMLDKWEILTVREDDGQQILPDVAKAVETYIAEKKLDKAQILGVGIGVPGPVCNGTVNRCENLGWGVTDVSGILSKMIGLPVYVGNDANMAALGEVWKGSGKGADNMVLVTLGTGIGGGIILGSRPLDGVHGAAGEIGHICVDSQEREPCSCGKFGCAEQYCSARGVVRLAKQHLQKADEDSALRRLEMLTCKDVFDACAAGDVLANEILERAYEYLGRVLAAVCNVVDPEVVVLGGGVSRAGQPLLDGAQRYFGKYVFHAARSVRFALASLGNDAGVYGAFKLVLDAVK